LLLIITIMNDEIKDQTKNYLMPVSIIFSTLLLAGVWVYSIGKGEIQRTQQADVAGSFEKTANTIMEEKVVPAAGVVLPIRWGDLGTQLVSTGVIDREKFESIYANRGGLSENERRLLRATDNGAVTITSQNAGVLLNLFWALGLSAKNEILEKGEMADPRYGGAENFASTGGWTIANGDPMDHYSAHTFFLLTPKQQKLVDKVSRGIYRPCCGNSVHFPDCNHGMAMLGFLELMASQGVSEQDMWNSALAVNSYWFPDTYLTIATYMEQKGIDWKNVNPKEVLGINYSSGQGFARIASQVELPEEHSGGNGCGVDAGGSVAPQPLPVVPKPSRGTQGGCGI